MPKRVRDNEEPSNRRSKRTRKPPADDGEQTTCNVCKRSMAVKGSMHCPHGERAHPGHGRDTMLKNCIVCVAGMPVVPQGGVEALQGSHLESVAESEQEAGPSGYVRPSSSNIAPDLPPPRVTETSETPSEYASNEEHDVIMTTGSPLIRKQTPSNVVQPVLVTQGRSSQGAAGGLGGALVDYDIESPSSDAPDLELPQETESSDVAASLCGHPQRPDEHEETSSEQAVDTPGAGGGADLDTDKEKQNVRESSSARRVSYPLIEAISVEATHRRASDVPPTSTRPVLAECSNVPALKDPITVQVGVEYIWQQKELVANLRKRIADLEEALAKAKRGKKVPISETLKRHGSTITSRGLNVSAVKVEARRTVTKTTSVSMLSTWRRADMRAVAKFKHFMSTHKVCNN
jgi:hypothetical protein